MTGSAICDMPILYICEHKKSSVKIHHMSFRFIINLIQYAINIYMYLTLFMYLQRDLHYIFTLYVILTFPYFVRTYNMVV
jgi:hypothetical protein